MASSSQPLQRRFRHSSSASLNEFTFVITNCKSSEHHFLSGICFRFSALLLFFSTVLQQHHRETGASIVLRDFIAWPTHKRIKKKKKKGCVKKLQPDLLQQQSFVAEPHKYLMDILGTWVKVLFCFFCC